MGVYSIWRIRNIKTALLDHVQLFNPTLFVIQRPTRSARTLTSGLNFIVTS